MNAITTDKTPSPTTSNNVKINNIKPPRPAKRQLFPEKLWDLVNKDGSGIQWSKCGKRIEVERTQLEKFIGTKFRSHNFDSFIRQLHFYGFRKCGNSYYHEKFQRGQPEALYNMKRKYSSIQVAPMCNSPHSVKSEYSPVASSMSTIDSVGVSCLNPEPELPIRTAPPAPPVLVPVMKSDAHMDLSSQDSVNDQSQLYSVDPKLSSVYSLKADYNSQYDFDKPNEYRVVGENVVKFQRSGDCIVIPIPESFKEHIGTPCPYLLVIRSTKYGRETILTAHYVYNCTRN